MGKRTAILAATACMACVGLSMAGHGVRQDARARAVANNQVVVDVFMPFSGPNAALGSQFALPGIIAAQGAINAGGGILGQQLTIIHTDTRGDPADAVPAASQLLATQPSLAAIFGPASDEAPATIPIFESAKIVMMSPAGQPSLDRSSNPYLFRPLAPDSTQGTAMSAAALEAGFTHAAIMFAADQGAQTVLPGLVRSFQRHGGSVTINEVLPQDQPSYRTEIERMFATHPQVIFTESDPQTAATLFSELQQLHGLTIPVIGSPATATQDYVSAVTRAVGRAAIGRILNIVTYGRPVTPGLATYLAAFRRTHSMADPSFTTVFYDAMNVLALAMDEAHSTVPGTYVGAIKDVTTYPSYTHVDDYMSGLAALKAGHKIYYEGAAGAMEFNQYNYVTGAFDVQQVSAHGRLVTVHHLSPADLTHYAS